VGLDDVEKRKFLPLPEIELRPLCRPARSQSLHRLRYPGSLIMIIIIIIIIFITFPLCLGMLHGGAQQGSRTFNFDINWRPPDPPVKVQEVEEG
jgi:hypothetical protein